MNNKLAWNLVGDELRAPSLVFHDEGSSLDYWLSNDGIDGWTAKFEGHVLAHGTLTEAIHACEMSELEGILEIKFGSSEAEPV